MPRSEKGIILVMPSFLPRSASSCPGPRLWFLSSQSREPLAQASCLLGEAPTAGSRRYVWDPTASFLVAEPGHSDLPVHLGIYRVGGARPPQVHDGREGARSKDWFVASSLLPRPLARLASSTTTSVPSSSFLSSSLPSPPPSSCSLSSAAPVSAVAAPPAAGGGCGPPLRSGGGRRRVRRCARPG